MYVTGIEQDPVASTAQCASEGRKLMSIRIPAGEFGKLPTFHKASDFVYAKESESFATSIPTYVS